MIDRLPQAILGIAQLTPSDFPTVPKELLDAHLDGVNAAYRCFIIDNQPIKDLEVYVFLGDPSVMGFEGKHTYGLQGLTRHITEAQLNTFDDWWKIHWQQFVEFLKPNNPPPAN